MAVAQIHCCFSTADQVVLEANFDACATTMIWSQRERGLSVRLLTFAKIAMLTALRIV